MDRRFVCVACRERFAFLARNYQNPCLLLRPIVPEGSLAPCQDALGVSDTIRSPDSPGAKVGSRATPIPLLVHCWELCLFRCVPETPLADPMLSPAHLNDVRIHHFEPATLGGQRWACSFGVRHRAII